MPHATFQSPSINIYKYFQLSATVSKKERQKERKKKRKTERKKEKEKKKTERKKEKERKKKKNRKKERQKERKKQRRGFDLLGNDPVMNFIIDVLMIVDKLALVIDKHGIIYPHQHI